MSSYVFLCIYKQPVSSFNYGKIQTTGAVLVAISIPIFTSQLEKAKEATDLANIRAAYAEACTDSLTTKDGGATTKDTVAMVSSGKIDKVENTVVGGFDCKDLEITKGKTCTISIDASGTVTITANK